MDSASATTSYEQAMSRLRTQAVLSLGDAALILGVDRKSLTKAIEAGQIPFIQIGAQRKIPGPKFCDMLGLSAATPAQEAA